MYRGEFMEIILIILFIVVLSILAGRYLNKMPNPGKRFYDSINIDDKK